jgi:hypothetical protein
MHALRDHLREQRANALAHAASVSASTGAVDPDSLRRVADLHIALTAVQEEIAAHLPKVGGGSEEPLA